MRIAFLVYEYPPRLVGGLGTYAQNICPELVKLGHDVSVFTMNDGKSKTREIVQGVDVHRLLIADFTDALSLFAGTELKNWGPGIKFFNDIFIYNILGATKLINELIKSEGYQFNLVAAHDWLSAIAGMGIKKETNLPFVFHVHSTEQGRTGGGSPIISSIEHNGGRLANMIITVSNSMKEDLIRHGFEETKISVVPNGVDPERYNPERVNEKDVQKLRECYGIGSQEKMLLFVGRVVHVKGVRSLVEAMVEVKDPQIKLVILGKGELEREISNLINEQGLGDRVKTRFEFVLEEERILHYAACDAAIFPSTYEPFGIVVLEAMAMEKPAIVGASGVVSGLREVVISSGDNQTGLHVNGNDPKDIAWGINTLFSDMERAKKWGENGRKRVEENFSWEKIAKKTIEVYKEVLKK